MFKFLNKAKDKKQDNVKYEYTGYHNLQEKHERVMKSFKELENEMSESFEVCDLSDYSPKKIIVFQTFDDGDDRYLNDYHKTYTSIQNLEDCICTRQMCFLNTSLFEKGYSIFIYNRDYVYEITLGENVYTKRHIKMGHDLLKLFMAGEFDKNLFDDIKTTLKDLKHLFKLLRYDLEDEGYIKSERCLDEKGEIEEK